MKKTVLLASLLLFATDLTAQFRSTSQNQIQAGLGVTWIDNRRFYSLRLRPEIAISKIGIGLDLNLEFDSSGTLRKENFNEFSDYMSIIRYVRYGEEFDSVYVKLGALDYVTIGHGSIINNYNNSPSFDSRRIGLQFNLNYGRMGVQTMYGNFGQAGVIGIRPYVKPLQFTTLTDLPILNNIEIGVTYAGDFDKYAQVRVLPFVSFLPFPFAGSYLTGEGSLSIIGADIGFPIVQGDEATLELYSDFVKIIDFGSGVATGILLRLDGIPLVNVRARLERRFNGAQYLPSYFNSFYEIERFDQTTPSAKSLILRNSTAYTKGVYGDLLVRVINTFDIFGSYEKLDVFPQSGALHIWTELAPKDAPVIARAGYDKVGIKDFNDLLTTDDRSLLYAEIGYRPYPFLILSTIYRWTYTPIRDGDQIVGYVPQKRVEPRIEFVYSF